MPASLEPILPHLTALLLVLSRMAGLFILAPVLSAAAIPMRIKLLLAISMSLCIYPLIPAPPLTWNPAEMALMIGAEVLIGLAIGFVAMLPLIAMRMAGTLIGQQLGLELAELYHPDHRDQTNVISQLLFMTALAAFLLLDGHRALFAALIGSFEQVPIGGYAPNGHFLNGIVGLLTAMTSLAIRVAAPVLCLVFLEMVTLGFLARTVPQLNVLSVGFPLRIVLGVALLAVAMVAMVGAFAGSMRQSLEMLARLFAHG